MKHLAGDDYALVPLLIGVAAVGVLLFGGSSLLTGEDPVMLLIEFSKAVIVASFLFVFGLLVLMGKLPIIPKPFAFLLGIAAIAGALYVTWWGFS